jgi:hypothetical protein
MERSKSIGLYNENRINALMDIPEIVDIIIKEVQGSVYVYIDTENTSLLDSLVEVARKVIQAQWIKGYPIMVYPPILRTVKMNISLSLKLADPIGTTQSLLATEIVNTITNSRMGDTIDFKTLALNAAATVDNIISAKVTSCTYNNRQLISMLVNQHFNERAVITASDIEIQ